jgi:acyl-CoA synthetase (AMP-forming)/AMP-acid ligase II
MEPTIIQQFKQQANKFAQKSAYIFLEDGEQQQSISFAQLDQQSEALAARIQAFMPSGDPIVLCLPAGIDFKISLLACLYAGVVIISLPLPDTNADHADSFGAVFNDTQAKVLLTTATLKPYLNQVLQNEPYFQELTIISTADLPVVPKSQWQQPKLTADTVAFCSYTSGTTGQPKGVIITHGNLLTSIQDISTDLAINHHQVLCTLFNHYHIIMTLWEMTFNLNGGQSIYLPLPTVLKKPILLLKTLSEYQVNILMGVNLTLDLCVNKIQDNELNGINLSHLKLLVGGDKVKTDLLEQFIARYENYGFNQSAVQSRYGQAEGFGFTSSINGEYPRIESISESALAANRILPPQNELDRIDLVTSGRPLPSVTLQLVDPDTLKSCRIKQVGEVWVKGKAIGKGYWNQPEKTAQTFGYYLQENQDGPFLRTGDMGYINERGELFLIGRLKERLTINGRYYYPEHIERTAKMSHPLLQSGACVFAAFSIRMKDSDKLVMAIEFEEIPQENDMKKIKPVVQENIWQVHQVELYDLLALNQNMIPRTKTGKIRRNQCSSLLGDKIHE